MRILCKQSCILKFVPALGLSISVSFISRVSLSLVLEFHPAYVMAQPHGRLGADIDIRNIEHFYCFTNFCFSGVNRKFFSLHLPLNGMYVSLVILCLIPNHGPLRMFKHSFVGKLQVEPPIFASWSYEPSHRCDVTVTSFVREFVIAH